jgi:hypothetical protein
MPNVETDDNRTAIAIERMDRTGEMRTDVLVYIAGPITAKDGYTIEENVAAGVRAYLDCLLHGFPAVCPHLSAGYPTLVTGLPYGVQIAHGLLVLQRCTHLLLLPRWETSEGAFQEHKEAVRRRIPVAGSIEELTDWVQHR